MVETTLVYTRGRHLILKFFLNKAGFRQGDFSYIKISIVNLTVEAGFNKFATFYFFQ